MTQSKQFSFFQIVESLEARWFMSSMATGAMGIFTFLIFSVLKILLLKYVSLFFIFLAFLIFIISSILTLVRIILFPKAVFLDSTHPIASHFFSGISISAGVLSTTISNILLPLHILPHALSISLATVLYLISIILGIIFFVMVSSMLITSKTTKSNHALGIWLLPPVGIFVGIFAGNFLSMHLSPLYATNILIAHLFCFGIALFGYFYTMNLIFHRIKFHPLPPSAMAPSFLIPLAPVGVSVIALLSFTSALENVPALDDVFSSISSFSLLYIPFIIGFGFFWMLSVFLVIRHYLREEGIPFSLGFWAFVFPVDAFGIGLFFASKILFFSFLLPVTIVVWIISLLLWAYVFMKTLSAIRTGKVFFRPKEVQ